MEGVIMKNICRISLFQITVFQTSISERTASSINNIYQYFYHDSVTHTDLIRRRWLDNHYYGTTWSVRSKHEKTEFILGGAWNKYADARHYGEIIWAEYAAGTKPGDTYYDNTGFKTDFNIFLKAGWSPVKDLTLVWRYAVSSDHL